MDHEKWLEQHDRMIADLDIKMAESAARHDRHERAMEAIDRRLDRAIRLGVREARHQRRRYHELEILLKAFLERGGNGKH